MPLAIHTIQILENNSDADIVCEVPDLAQEEKLSSSDIRRSMLGSFRRPQVRLSDCMIVCSRNKEKREDRIAGIF